MWFFGLTRVHNPNGTSIGSAVFCWAQDCDRHTDVPTWMTWGIFHICGCLRLSDGGEACYPRLSCFLFEVLMKRSRRVNLRQNSGASRAASVSTSCNTVTALLIAKMAPTSAPATTQVDNNDIFRCFSFCVDYGSVVIVALVSL